MAKQKTQTSSGDVTLQELYNALMYEIEPDLVTDMLPDLADMYANESDEEREERAERYARAFEIFSDEFETILELWKKELLNFKSQALATFKAHAAKEDASHLSDIEHFIDEQ